MKKEKVYIADKFYIYEWFNLDTGYVFYVGKGCGYRYKDIKSRNSYFISYYKKYNCDVRKTYECLYENKAYQIEEEQISLYRKCGQACCNIADGGIGYNRNVNDEPICHSNEFFYEYDCESNDGSYNEEGGCLHDDLNKTEDELEKEMYEEILINKKEQQIFSIK